VRLTDQPFVKLMDTCRPGWYWDARTERKDTTRLILLVLPRLIVSNSTPEEYLRCPNLQKAKNLNERKDCVKTTRPNPLQSP
jgi:hypothetical protein